MDYEMDGESPLRVLYIREVEQTTKRDAETPRTVYLTKSTGMEHMIDLACNGHGPRALLPEEAKVHGSCVL
jgi:hypothetical protein